jgi:HEAT repeat protein
MRSVVTTSSLPLLLVAAGLLALVLTSPLANAAEIAVAGDGALELREGKTVLARVPLKTSPVRRGTPVLREVTIDGHRIADIRVPIRGTARQEVWIGELGGSGKAPRLIWNGISGARDADEEVATQVEVSPERIVEYQTAANVTRCDGEVARLFPRAWDFESHRFRPVLSAAPAAAGQKLVARRGDPAMPTGRPIGGFHWTVASTTSGAGTDARSLSAPSALDDGNPATVWSEGLGGDGRGEFLTARATAGRYRIRGVRILPGDGSSEAAFKAKNRLRRFQLALGPAPEQRFDVELPDDPAADKALWRQPYWVALPKPIESSCVTLVIAEVIPGSEAAPPRNFGVTAISDVEVFTELDGPEGAERLVADIAKGADCDARVPLLVNLGEPAVLPTAQTILSSKGPGRECLLEALTRLNPAPQNPIVTDALVAGLLGASAKEERLITEALGRAQPPPVRALEAVLSRAQVAVDDRMRAARTLGALDQEAAATALLAAAGRGPAPVRGAVVQALGKSPAVRPELLVTAMARAEKESPARYGDLLRALAPAAKRHPEGRGQALGALRAAMGSSRPFEVRARAVMAMGDLKLSEGVPDLAALRASSDEPVLRYLAARELAGIGGEAAVKALRGALRDADPRVRETAAQGLGHLRDRAAAGEIMEAAKQEPWPFVRRAELEALGRLCAPGSGDLMIRASEKDVHEVRRAALVSLVRCKDPRSRSVLLRTLGRRNEAATMRELSAALLGELADAGAASEMAAALARLVNESEADIALEGVTTSTLRALAQLGGPAAVTAAVTLANDTRHPFRQAAVEALGRLCDPQAGAATLRKLASGPESPLTLAAHAAQRRCSGATK